MNVTSPGVSDDVTRDVIEACASRLNASLQRQQQLDSALADRLMIMTRPTSRDDDDGMKGQQQHAQPLTVIQSTNLCPQARMTAEGFFYLSSGWQCPRDLQFDLQRWRCVSRTRILWVTSLFDLALLSLSRFAKRKLRTYTQQKAQRE